MLSEQVMLDIDLKTVLVKTKALDLKVRNPSKTIPKITLHRPRQEILQAKKERQKAFL